MYVRACATSLLLLLMFFTLRPLCADVFLQNLSEECFRCLCHVTTKCNMSATCKAGYCGPFSISRVYWFDAGKITLPIDDPERNLAWEDCSKNYECAKNIIRGYLQKFGQDCNNNGVTDCFDYIMINQNGGYGCSAPLSDTENGRQVLKRYEECIVAHPQS